MNELESMRAFVKVVEAGSFAEAARQTGTSKSVMTKRVNQLEALLQLELLQRSTRRLDITDTGTNFYERCVRLLAELDNAKSAVSSIEWGLSGTFRVSCISSFTAAYLADDLCEFQASHPNLQIELHQHDRICDPVQEGFDVCLQPTITPNATIEEHDVLTLKRLVVATPDYVEKHGMPEKPADLRAHRFAYNTHIQPDCSIMFEGKHKATKIQVKPVMLTNTVWLLRSAVLQGDCLARMPVFFIEKELTSGKLVPILPQYRIEGTKLTAYYRKSQFVPLKIRIFLNFLRQKYGQYPPWEQRLVKECPELAENLAPQESSANPQRHHG